MWKGFFWSIFRYIDGSIFIGFVKVYLFVYLFIKFFIKFWIVWLLGSCSCVSDEVRLSLFWKEKERSEICEMLLNNYINNLNVFY